MDLARALRLISSPFAYSPLAKSVPIAKAFHEQARTIAFTGAGGKTTAIFQLAHGLSAVDNQPVVVSATSHLAAGQLQLADHHRIALQAGELDNLPDSGIILVTGALDGDRTLPLPPLLLSRLRDLCSARGICLLIEADGSRSRPLKAPAGHEPPIPEFADLVVVVAGLAGLFQPLSEEVVHRPERFTALSGLRNGDSITMEALVRVLLHPEGGLKNIPPTARRVVLLNQADGAALQSIGGKMAPLLLQDYDSVLVGSLHNSSFQTIENTAGIILAAGESTRFGKPKQLLDWHGQTFVRAVAHAALDAGLRPVVVITGAYADQVEASLNDLHVKTLRNSGWSEGQASSIRSGIHFLGSQPPNDRPGAAGSAVFLLADQPQVTVSILEALAAAHTLDLQPIIAPLVLDRRANPVLFDRITFEDLRRLHGDIGGRGIFDRYQVEYLPWHDDRLLLDVDTPEQYARLVEDDTL